jgi:hypothetical protein
MVRFRRDLFATTCLQTAYKNAYPGNLRLAGIRHELQKYVSRTVTFLPSLSSAATGRKFTIFCPGRGYFRIGRSPARPGARVKFFRRRLATLASYQPSICLSLNCVTTGSRLGSRTCPERSRMDSNVIDQAPSTRSGVVPGLRARASRAHASDLGYGVTARL